MRDESFLNAIRSDRESDVPRLVYADWLEEHGEADRAWLIRLQCDQERLESDDPRLPEIKMQVEALLARRRDDWLGPWPAELVRRGFVEGRCPVFALPQLTPDHLAAPLLLDLTLSTEMPQREPLFGLDGHPALARVTRLELGGRHDDHLADLHYLLAAPFPKLDTLLLGFFPTGGRVLRAIERMPSLCRLHLTKRYWNNPPALSDWQEFFSAPFLRQIRELHLADQSIDAPIATLLAQSAHVRGLARLNLSGNRIGALGAVHLAGAPALQGIVDLDVSGNRIRDTGVRALASCENLKCLQRLRLSENEIGGPGVRAIVASSYLPCLRRLSLDKNYVGNSAALSVAESDLLGRLTHLELGQDLGNEALAVLASSPNTARLRELELSGSGISDRGLRLLSESPYFPALKCLRIASSRIHEDGLLALLCSPLGARIRELELPGCQVSAERIHILMTSPELRTLRRLRVIADAPMRVQVELCRRYEPRLIC